METPRVFSCGVRGATKGMDLAYDAGSCLGQVAVAAFAASLSIVQSKHANSGKIAVVHTEREAVRRALRYGVMLKTYHEPQSIQARGSVQQAEASNTLPTLLGNKQCAKASVDVAKTQQIYQKSPSVCEHSTDSIALARGSASEGQICVAKRDDVVERDIGFVSGTVLLIPFALVGSLVGGLTGLTEDVGNALAKIISPSEVKLIGEAGGDLSDNGMADTLPDGEESH